MLGRKEERATLDGLVRAAADGRGAALVMEGEPGVGKTALLEDVASRASRFHVLRVAGVQSELSLPYAALHQLCHRIISRRDRLPSPQADALAVALGGQLGPAPDRFLVSLAALGLLSDLAAEQPLLCLVDDAQWIDLESLQAFAFVARRAEADSLAILLSTRVALDELAGVPRLVIEGLGESDARELLASVAPGRLDPRVRDRIVAETRGNPLALLELPHGLDRDQLAGGFGLPNPTRLSRRIEDGFLRRTRALPTATQELLLLVAADPVGGASVLQRAALTVGVSLDDDAGPAEEAGLIRVARQITFRHPLVRSAIYGAAGAAERRRIHGALASALDSEHDRDHRAWHLAHATTFPDDEVAEELERSAARAKARGGPAAAAAFLERAANLTSDPGRVAKLNIATAELKYDAGALSEASALLAGVDEGALHKADRAQLDLIRARILFTASGSGDTVVLLAGAAKQLEAVSVDLARATYLHAFSAATILGRDVTGDQWLELAHAAATAPPSDGPETARDRLLDGFTLQLTDGFDAGLPSLQRALASFVANDEQVPNLIEVLWLACCAAIVVWDDAAWHALSERFVNEGRRTGALVHLLAAVQMRAVACVLAGDFPAAASLAEEQNLLTSVVGPTHGGRSAATFLTAWQGNDAPDAANASSEGHEPWGFEADVSCYATAVWCNAQGRYRSAMDAARVFLADPSNGFGRWAPALPELVEAASRCDQPEIAMRAVDQLASTTAASGTDWAVGLEALCRALISDDDSAEAFFVEAVDRLARTRIATSFARTRLLYGEWLRRLGRRTESREQLRAARGLFLEMGADGFAARAERELLVTGEKARPRTDDTRGWLTAQERQIAELARAGYSNPEIGSQLFLSRRTIEYHLHKVFTKLAISSRAELADALPAQTPLPEVLESAAPGS